MAAPIKINVDEDLIREVFDKNQGHVRKTAEELKMSYSTLRKRLISMGILYKYKDEDYRRKKAARLEKGVKIIAAAESESHYAFKKDKIDSLLGLKVGKEVTVLYRDRRAKRVIEEIYPHQIKTTNPRNHTTECYTKGELLMYNLIGG